MVIPAGLLVRATFFHDVLCILAEKLDGFQRLTGRSSVLSDHHRSIEYKAFGSVL